MRKRVFALVVGVMALAAGVALAKLAAAVWRVPEVAPVAIPLERPQGIEPLATAAREVRSGAYRVFGPFAHKNLAVFFVRGGGLRGGRSYLTLEEAMGRGLVRVHETGEVNVLAFENLSAGEDVFAQAGDVVKGGRQDRALAVDVVVRAGAGRVPVEVFCVEQGRWSERAGAAGGGEGVDMASAFTMSEMISTPDLRTAVRELASQTAVWAGVERAQERLAAGVGGDVRSAESATSLPMTLEGEKVSESVETYVASLARAAEGRGDVVGFVFAINGRIGGGDIYASPALFRKLWPRLLRSAAVEAVAGLALETSDAATVEAVRDFLADAEAAGGVVQERFVSERVRMAKSEGARGILWETRDLAGDAPWLHRNYAAK